MLSSAIPAPKNDYVVREDVDNLKKTTADSKNKPSKRTIPVYPCRNGFIPLDLEDYNDGGAYPEIPVVQYPLNMGKPGQKNTSVISLSVDEQGDVKYDAIVKQGSKGKIVKVGIDSVKEKAGDAQSLALPTPEEEASCTEKTRKALESLLEAKVSSSLTSRVSEQKNEPTFVRYTPNPNAVGINAGGQQRVIKMVEAQVDPLEPPKQEFKKVPKANSSPPVPVLHSPPRKLTVEDQQAWKVPPCISNWKNSKGFIIPLDKRLAADGRGLQEVTLNNKFATFSEALYLAEIQAGEDLRIRNEIQKKLAMKEKEDRELQLRDFAAKARLERNSLFRKEEDDEDVRPELADRDRENDDQSKELKKDYQDNIENQANKKSKDYHSEFSDDFSDISDHEKERSTSATATIPSTSASLKKIGSRTDDSDDDDDDDDEDRRRRQRRMELQEDEAKTASLITSYNDDGRKLNANKLSVKEGKEEDPNLDDRKTKSREWEDSIRDGRERRGRTNSNSRSRTISNHNNDTNHKNSKSTPSSSSSSSSSSRNEKREWMKDRSHTRQEKDRGRSRSRSSSSASRDSQDSDRSPIRRTDRNSKAFNKEERNSGGGKDRSRSPHRSNSREGRRRTRTRSYSRDRRRSRSGSSSSSSSSSGSRSSNSRSSSRSRNNEKSVRNRRDDYKRRDRSNRSSSRDRKRDHQSHRTRSRSSSTTSSSSSSTSSSTSSSSSGASSSSRKYSSRDRKNGNIQEKKKEKSLEEKMKEEEILREKMRVEKRKEHERQLRLENLKGARKVKATRDEGRDISEKIALGIHRGTGKLTGESLFDSRLFNQSAGLNSGFGGDDEYNTYTQPLFNRTGVDSIYRPRANQGGDDELSEEQANAEIKKLQDTSRFRPDKGFRGTEGGSHGQHPSGSSISSGPVQFERSDPRRWAEDEEVDQESSTARSSSDHQKLKRKRNSSCSGSEDSDSDDRKRVRSLQSSDSNHRRDDKDDSDRDSQDHEDPFDVKDLLPRSSFSRSK